MDFGFAEVMAEKDLARISGFSAGNPLNALPVPAMQDAIARGCYVRLSAVVPRRRRGLRRNRNPRECGDYTTFFSSPLLASPVHAREMLPPGFVFLRDVDSSIAQDMRYATSDNFTGHPLPGYSAR